MAGESTDTITQLQNQLRDRDSRIKDLEAVLKQNDIDLAFTYRLPPKLSDLLGLLLGTRVVTSEMIQQRLEISSDAKVAIHRLRAAMKPYGFEPKCTPHGRRGIGYWLDDETKRHIQSAVTPAVTAIMDQVLAPEAAPATAPEVAVEAQTVAA